MMRKKQNELDGPSPLKLVQTSYQLISITVWCFETLLILVRSRRNEVLRATKTKN